MRTFTDRVAVVTGAGSGIGRALALDLARRGARLAITDRSEEALAPVADHIRTHGGTVTTHAFDVGDRAAWPGFVEAVLREHGAVHLAINNAGVALIGPFRQYSLDDLEWQLRVNLWGVIYGCHFLLPLLEAQEDAHLVNVSSLFGIVTVPDNSAYCLTKHAVRSLSEALEMELRGSSVRVSSVHPGGVATRIAEDSRFHDGPRLDSVKAKKIIRKGLAPEVAADTILRGVLANRRTILVGRDAWLLSTIYRLSPSLFHELAIAFTRRGARSAPATG